MSHGWVLSSSDSDDDKLIIIGSKKPLISTSTFCDNSKEDKNSEDECYIPLSKRLQKENEIPTYSALEKKKNMRNKTFENRKSCSDDDDLPVFSLNLKNQKKTDTETKKLDNIEKMQISKSKIKTTKTKKIDEGKQERKALQNHIKSLRPTECLKYITCEISNLLPLMLDDPVVLDKLSNESEANFMIATSDLPCVKWKRKVELDELTEMNDEPELAILLSVQEFIEMTCSQKIENSNDNSLSIKSWFKKLSTSCPGYRLHPILFGLSNYRKKVKRKQRNEFRRQVEELSNLKKNKRKKLKENDLTVLENWEIEETLVELQFACNVTINFIENVMDFVTLITQMTKAIAEAPFKRMSRQDGMILMDIPAVKVNSATSQGVKKCWKQMLQQFENVSPDMASAIVDKYPTIMSLIEAYRTCSNNKEKAKYLLEDLVIRRGVGTIQTRRRIGPELSRKIYQWCFSNFPTETL